MGLCPETDPGCNECEGYPHDPHDPIWVGMFDIQAGQMIQVGCHVGCLPCRQAELSYNFLRPGGNRWLRAHMPNDSSEAILPNRMANGMVGDLQSMRVGDYEARTRRVPERINFLRGVCYQNLYEGEAFGKGDIGADACDCDVRPDTSLDPESMSCGGGEGPGEPVAGAFPDDFFHHNIGDLDSDFFCRRIEQHDSETSVVTSVGLFPPTIFHTKDCGGNMFLQCTRRRTAGAPCYEFEDDASFLDEHHQAFNFVPIELVGLTIKRASFPFANDPVIDFKNAVLAHLSSLPGPSAGGIFEQLDYHGADGLGAANGWSRFYNPSTTDCGALSMPEIPFQFGRCYLEQTNVTVHVVPYISKASIEVWMIAQHVNETDIGIATIQKDKERIYPHVRIRIQVQVSYLAKLGAEIPIILESWWPDDHPHHGRSTELRIVNADDPDYPTEGVFCQYPAIVAPVEGPPGGTLQDPLANQPDHIVCVDSRGRRFEIPNRVEWWGYMGVHSGTRNVWIYDPNPFASINQLAYPCCRLLKSLDGLEVGGWPTLFESATHPAALYGGFVRFNFAAGNYPSVCES